MRPGPKAGSELELEGLDVLPSVASMRPGPKAGSEYHGDNRRRWHRGRFNEARPEGRE